MAAKNTSVTPDNMQETPASTQNALAAAELRKKELVKIYSSQKKVPVSLAPMYAAHFGNIMRVSLNGVSIAIKVDGSTAYVPEAFAAEIHARRMAVDAHLLAMRRMSNVSRNAEQSPGELRLF